MKDLVTTLPTYGLRIAAVLFVLGALAAFAPGRAEAATVNVTVTNFYYCESQYEFGVCPTAVVVDDTVMWNFSGAYHTVTECGGASCDDTPPATPIFDSGLRLGGSYSFVFDTPGTYLYQCEVHTTQMRGSITVSGGVGGDTELPGAAVAPLSGDRSSGGSIWPIAALAIAAALATGGLAGAAGWYARKRRVA